MKNTLKLVCLVGATLAVSACSGYTTYEQTPYQGRTTGVVKTDAKVVKSAEPIFKDTMRK